MHNILEMYDNLPDSLLDPKAIAEGWQAYKQVNKTFRDKVLHTLLRDWVLLRYEVYTVRTQLSAIFVNCPVPFLSLLFWLSLPRAVLYRTHAGY